MTILINHEAKQRIRHPLELDNMAERYKTTTELFTFTSPSLWVIEKHLFFLLRNSTQKDFDPKYSMRPDYLAFDEYGTVTLGPLLMYVNGVPSLEDFELLKVIVPDFQSIIEITQDKFRKKTTDELEEVDW
ncbi:hypothetical protein KAR91_24930 [Candidatus Pacearchaeota archaeon]|nr:hypothetical protein [Candidatus Pacearchaeota archaeon]